MLKNWLKALESILFPPVCFCCYIKIQKKQYLCAECKSKIEFLYPPTCRFCAIPVTSENNGCCKNCRQQTLPYDRIISIVKYKSPILNLIHAFKYNGHDYLDNFFSNLMTGYLANTGFNKYAYDTITAIPLHAHKLKERGFNQAELLAKNLANYFKIPFKNDIIYKLKNNSSQAKLKKKDREENIKDSFAVKEEIEGKRIILVDDIFTTGSTVKECASKLREAGAKKIVVITLAKTLM